MKEKLHSVKAWAVRGAKNGSMFCDPLNDHIQIARTRKALLKMGVHPEHIVRVEIKEPSRKKP